MRRQTYDLKDKVKHIVSVVRKMKFFISDIDCFPCKLLLATPGCTDMLCVVVIQKLTL